MQQTVVLASRDDQLIVRTPFGESFVVSAQAIGNKQHIYLTPPEGFKKRPDQGETTVFEREIPA